ncbi:PAS domain-containing protein [Methylobacterium nigriterrae]|uniref:PAS domain-containing protein n=1 Tax=Methylobacterium nigriterrae TaxID=3127512 RepID=UPI0030141B38
MTINIPTLAFSSREFLRMIESFGLSGSWGWNFSRKEYVWSSGLYKLFGIEDGSVQPDYELYRSLVHPDDRLQLEDAAQILNEGLLTDHTFRVIRPDGTMRIVVSRGDVYFTPEGAPAGAAGVLVDVTSQQRASHAVRTHNDRQRAVFEHSSIIPWVWTVDGEVLHAPGWCELTGLPPEDLPGEWHRPVVAEERAAFLRQHAEHRARGQAYTLDFTARLASGEHGAFRALVAPVMTGTGTIREWTGLTFPADSTALKPRRDALSASGDERVRGLHLRAARGLLDWTLADLAKASKLSLSTIRRLEEDAEGPLARSRHAAIEALRQAGVVFTVVEGSTVAVARTR